MGCPCPLRYPAAALTCAPRPAGALPPSLPLLLPSLPARRRCVPLAGVPLPAYRRQSSLSLLPRHPSGAAAAAPLRSRERPGRVPGGSRRAPATLPPRGRRVPSPFLGPAADTPPTCASRPDFKLLPRFSRAVSGLRLTLEKGRASTLGADLRYGHPAAHEIRCFSTNNNAFK